MSGSTSCCSALLTDNRSSAKLNVRIARGHDELCLVHSPQDGNGGPGAGRRLPDKRRVTILDVDVPLDIVQLRTAASAEWAERWVRPALGNDGCTGGLVDRGWFAAGPTEEPDGHRDDDRGDAQRKRTDDPPPPTPHAQIISGRSGPWVCHTTRPDELERLTPGYRRTVTPPTSSPSVQQVVALRCHLIETLHWR